ncbi:src-like-adapter 2 [Clupea harengus]|uniref:Src-like-adapter 2 n=1 Tax=Clupea harengus TaxID=7950 RepID=A0A6P8F320_CLUHA|nr:src-like-adapter 2 [Clupea harengus]XP_031422948.1 src-like-adapter 2 [Clupea harengus]
MGHLPSKRRRPSSTTSTADPAGSEHINTAGQTCMTVALNNFPREGPAANTVCMGDRLTIISDAGDMWKVKVGSTGKDGYIPKTYVAKVMNKWQYEGITRAKAEELLLRPQNQSGSYLVRQSQTCKGTYSLSVVQGQASALRVKHYRIHSLSNGWFYIFTTHTFPSIGRLVDHYSDSSDGLCCLLTKPCHVEGSFIISTVPIPSPVFVRKPTFNWKRAKRSMIFHKKEAREEPEDSPFSEGLREAMNSYLFTSQEETLDSED